MIKSDKIAATGVVREPGWLYFIDKELNVRRSPMVRPGTPEATELKNQLVASSGLQREPDYMYMLDKDGDIARVSTKPKKAPPKVRKSIKAVCDALNALGPQDFANPPEGITRLYEISEALDGCRDPTRALPTLYATLERLGDEDLGTPGPLVSAIEALDAGGVELAASCRRRLNQYNLWMISRLLNATQATTERAPLAAIAQRTRQRRTPRRRPANRGRRDTRAQRAAVASRRDRSVRQFRK